MKDPNEYLRGAKEEVAKKHGYKSWFAFETLNLTPSMHFSRKVVSLLEEAALLALQNQCDDKMEWV